MINHLAGINQFGQDGFVHHAVNGIVKAGVGFQVADIADAASRKVVNDIDFLTENEEVFSQVGADKTRPSRD